MTGKQRRGDTPMGPPWSVDVLADLHAGVFEDAESEHLWPLVQADPAAREVLAALDAAVADLRGFAELTAGLPAEPMPAEFAARLDAAIGAEVANRAAPAPQATPQSFAQPATAPPAPPSGAARVVDLAAARRRRNRQLGWAGGILATAAAVAAAVLIVVAPHGGTTGNPVAAPPSNGAGATAGGGEALSSGGLNLNVAIGALNRSDYGPLDTPQKRAACLAANGLDPNRQPAGGARVTLDGKPGVLMVLTTGQLARFRLLVVGPDCATGNPDTLANTVVGGASSSPTR